MGGEVADLNTPPPKKRSKESRKNHKALGVASDGVVLKSTQTKMKEVKLEPTDESVPVKLEPTQ
jgi:hypothetical protein